MALLPDLLANIHIHSCKHISQTFFFYMERKERAENQANVQLKKGKPQDNHLFALSVSLK